MCFVPQKNLIGDTKLSTLRIGYIHLVLRFGDDELG